MGLSSWQVLRAWTCHRQPKKMRFIFFLIELIEIYLPVPIVYFSNEKMRPHRRNTAHVKYPYINDFWTFSKISIFGLLTIASYTVFCQDFHCGNEELIRRSKWWFMTELLFYKKINLFSDFFGVQKALEDIAKLAGNANWPRIPIKIGVGGRREAPSILVATRFNHWPTSEFSDVFSWLLGSKSVPLPSGDLPTDRPLNRHPSPNT